MNPCPICQSLLELVLLSKPSGNIKHFECWSCNRYMTDLAGYEIIKQNGKWWILIDKVDKDITVFDRSYPKLFITYPLVPINYTNPQETIDKLVKLKAFL